MIGIVASEAMGYKIRDVRQMGDIAAIVVNPKTGMLESVNDPRYRPRRRGIDCPDWIDSSRLGLGGDGMLRTMPDGGRLWAAGRERPHSGEMINGALHP